MPVYQVCPLLSVEINNRTAPPGLSSSPAPPSAAPPGRSAAAAPAAGPPPRTARRAPCPPPPSAPPTPAPGPQTPAPQLAAAADHPAAAGARQAQPPPPAAAAAGRPRWSKRCSRCWSLQVRRRCAGAGWSRHLALDPRLLGPRLRLNSRLRPRAPALHAQTGVGAGCHLAGPHTQRHWPVPTSGDCCGPLLCRRQPRGTAETSCRRRHCRRRHRLPLLLRRRC